MKQFSRRRLLMGAAGLAGASLPAFAAKAQPLDAGGLYGPIEGEPFPVAGINLSRIKPGYLRSIVDYDTNEKPGTIVVDPTHKYLYLTDGSGQAIRYGVGVGRQGFGWSGTASIHDKREWPDWYPPKEMIARDPHIMAQMSQLQSGTGMHGGPGNPLGARAMYLFQGSKDTLYRIHGTVEPWTIGTSVSSGCIRMINQDAIDLYGRVSVGTKVVVLASGAGRAVEPEARMEAEPEPQLQPRYRQDPAEAYDPYDPLGFDRGGYGTEQ